MARIIVTGAAGSLGRRVTALLAAARGPGEVVAVDAAPAGAAPAGVAVRAVDLAAADAGAVADVLDEVASGADAIVHLAWDAGDDPGRDPADVAEANVSALRRTLAAAAAGGVGQVVHLSSATVYGAWRDNRVPLTEDALLRPNPGFAFAAAKAEAERVVDGWAQEHPGVAVAVLRPAVTVGTPERPLYVALGATRVPTAGDGARPVQYLHVDDLASAVVHTVEHRLTGVYNVAPDVGVEERTARALSGGVARVRLPPPLSRPLGALGWGLWRRGTPAEILAYTEHPWVVAPDRLRATGWQPRFTSEEALVATDGRPHLDDLSPGRRQHLVLAATVGAAVTAGGVATAVALRLRSRR